MLILSAWNVGEYRRRLYAELLLAYGYRVRAASPNLNSTCRLCGRPPFWSRNQRKLFEQIQREPVRFRADYGWGSVSKEAKDLIEKMLKKEPAERITAAQMLEHPWLIDKHTYSENDLKGSTHLLTQYLAGSLEDHD